MTPEALPVFGCDLSGVTLIEASAGTGKTWNICALYMRLLLQRGLRVDEILVVTYTNAATAELRERIRARIVATLARLRGGAPDANDDFVERLLHTLRDAHGRDDEDMRRRLELALQTFDEAAIFTIHGFCERALRDTPFGAGMPLSMELVTDDAALCLDVARDFWRRHVAAGPLVPGLAGLLLERGDDPATLAGLLRRRAAKPLARELWPPGIDASGGYDPAALQRAHAAARTVWLGERDEICAAVREALPRLNGNVYRRGSLDVSIASWDRLLQDADPDAAPHELDKLALLTEASLQPKARQAPPRPHRFHALAGELLAERDAQHAALALERLRLLRRLLHDGHGELQRAKLARRLMSFDDMLSNLHERLSGGRHPWLARVLRQRFPAALIDEFQDTDPVQFSIFRTIYADAQTPLFLVGDPKQAIYSFRNADLHVYLRARREADRVYTLAENQRCTASLLAGLNALFGHRPGVFGVAGLAYIRLAVGSKRRAPFADATLPRAPLQLWSLPQAGGASPPPKADAQHLAAQACAAEIARLLVAGQRGAVTLDGRALGAGDIAVLVRTRKEGSRVRTMLAQHRIGSVELSGDSIFASAEAAELERVLVAILEPARVSLVRAALATTLLGWTAAQVAAPSADDAAVLAGVMRFSAYREEWLRSGIGTMLRRLMVNEGIGARLLSLPFGERRMTNFLHLAEMLHGAGAGATAPDVLLRWLQARLGGDADDDAAQLRLESDRNLVQIVTIHKSKGLEYPVVFCPFLWDGHPGRADALRDGREYHDADGALVIDFRTPDRAEREGLDARREADRNAERLRMTYVALTRAVHRCYVVVGTYLQNTAGGSSTAESRKAALNRLVTAADAPAADIDAAWRDFAATAAPEVGLEALPAASADDLVLPAGRPEAVEILAPPAQIPPGWRIGSYSQLIHGATREAAIVDHDLRALPADTPPQADTPPPADSGVPAPAAAATGDILRFPRGITAGHCIHAVFEHADFTQPAGWPAVIDRALRAFPQAPRPGTSADELPAMLAGMLGDVVRTPMPGGFLLADVVPARRLTELRFSLPAAQFAAPALRQVLAAHGLPLPALGFATLQGYLNGAIDLVIEAGGRFWVVDWKSNYLGDGAAHYRGAALQAAMDQHQYHLQYLIYLVALHRYLQRRIPGYRYETHVGGALYLFVRAVRPAWSGSDGQPAGVYCARPAAGLVERLSALLDRGRVVA